LKRVNEGTTKLGAGNRISFNSWDERGRWDSLPKFEMPETPKQLSNIPDVATFSTEPMTPRLSIDFSQLDRNPSVDLTQLEEVGAAYEKKKSEYALLQQCSDEIIEGQQKKLETLKQTNCELKKELETLKANLEKLKETCKNLEIDLEQQKQSKCLQSS